MISSIRAVLREGVITSPVVTTNAQQVNSNGEYQPNPLFYIVDGNTTPNRDGNDTLVTWTHATHGSAIVKIYEETGIGTGIYALLTTGVIGEGSPAGTTLTQRIGGPHTYPGASIRYYVAYTAPKVSSTHTTFTSVNPYVADPGGTLSNVVSHGSPNDTVESNYTGTMTHFYQGMRRDWADGGATDTNNYFTPNESLALPHFADRRRSSVITFNGGWIKGSTRTTHV